MQILTLSPKRQDCELINEPVNWTGGSQKKKNGE